MPDTPPPAGNLAQNIVQAALAAAAAAAGKPYTVGGQTPDGFDCSGFVTYVFRQVFPSYTHMDTGHIVTSQLFAPASAAQAADLIFFPAGVNPYDGKSYPNHVGIVLDGKTWIGSQTSTGVARVPMTNLWWSPREKRLLRYTLLA